MDHPIGLHVIKMEQISYDRENDLLYFNEGKKVQESLNNGE